MTHRYFVRGAQVPAYHPANHALTSNQRLIGPDNGAQHLEVVLGTIARGGGAMARHASRAIGTLVVAGLVFTAPH